MQIREYGESDLAKIKELHSKSGFGYQLPDLSDPSVFSRRVVCDSSEIAMAGFLRLTAEAFLICNPTWRVPAWRDLALRQLQHACRRDAFEKGVSEVNAFLPPAIEHRFGPRLLKMGWKRYLGDEWKAYSFEV